MKWHGWRTKRMQQQKWQLDKIIEATGVDYGWPMSKEALEAAGFDVLSDINSIRSRIKTYGDISKEYARVAEKREMMAEKAYDEGNIITARDNYFAAAIFYHMAQWPIHEDDNEELVYYNTKMNLCCDKFIEHAPYRVERVEIPFEGKSLPGFLHYPRNCPSKVPCVAFIDGMDAGRLTLVRPYGDKLLERGMAVLAFDGPGQGECCVRKIRVTADNFARAGKAAMDFLINRPEIDAEKIAIAGVSMGTFWVPQIVAYDQRFKAAAVFYVCHEPGMNTIFNVEAPTFKERYMWMAGYEDEDEFDKFAKTLTLKGVGAKIKCPILIIAGENDELSPLQYTYDFCNEIVAPKKIVVFEGARHGISHAGLGSEVRTMVADWLKNRLEGKPMQSERIFIDSTGKETRK